MKRIMAFASKVLPVLGLIACIQAGCATSNYRHKAYQDMKDFVLNEDYAGIWYLLFFETNIKNQITYESAFDLQRDLYYSPKFKGKNIESYFRKIMLGEIILSCEDLLDCFTLVPSITEEYQKQSFTEFLKKHATYIEEDNTYIIHPSFNYDEKLTISYYLYLNNYYTSEDDYSGYFTSRKDSLYPKMEIINEDDLQEIKED